MVDAQALNDLTAAIVADSVEAMMAQHIHEREEISRHLALTGLGVIGMVRHRLPFPALIPSPFSGSSGQSPRARWCENYTL
jgi:hypothetical protein